MRPHGDDKRTYGTDTATVDGSDDVAVMEARRPGRTVRPHIPHQRAAGDAEMIGGVRVDILALDSHPHVHDLARLDELVGRVASDVYGHGEAEALVGPFAEVGGHADH